MISTTIPNSALDFFKRLEKNNDRDWFIENKAEFKKIEAEVKKGGKVLLDFYSTECPPCEALAPKLEGLENLFSEQLKFLKIFRQGNRDLSDQLGVQGSPWQLRDF